MAMLVSESYQLTADITQSQNIEECQDCVDTTSSQPAITKIRLTATKTSQVHLRVLPDTHRNLHLKSHCQNTSCRRIYFSHSGHEIKRVFSTGYSTHGQKEAMCLVASARTRAAVLGIWLRSLKVLSSISFSDCSSIYRIRSDLYRVNSLTGCKVTKVNGQVFSNLFKNKMSGELVVGETERRIRGGWNHK